MDSLSSSNDSMNERAVPGGVAVPPPSPPGRVVLIMGAPGSGKSLLGNALKKQHTDEVYDFVNVGELLRRTGKVDEYFQHTTAARKHQLQRLARTILEQTFRSFKLGMKSEQLLLLECVKEVDDAYMLMEVMREKGVVLAQVLLIPDDQVTAEQLRLTLARTQSRSSVRDEHRLVAQRQSKWQSNVASLIEFFSSLGVLCELARKPRVKTSRTHHRNRIHRSFTEEPQAFPRLSSLGYARHAPPVMPPWKTILWDLEVTAIEPVVSSRLVVYAAERDRVLQFASQSSGLHGRTGSGLHSILALPSKSVATKTDARWLAVAGRYAVSRKCDGTRHLLIVDESGMPFLLNRVGMLYAYPITCGDGDQSCTSDASACRGTYISSADSSADTVDNIDCDTLAGHDCNSTAASNPCCAGNSTACMAVPPGWQSSDRSGGNVFLMGRSGNRAASAVRRGPLPAGTILDGELVWGHKSADCGTSCKLGGSFLVFDALAVGMTRLWHLPLYERLDTMQQLLNLPASEQQLPAQATQHMSGNPRSGTAAHASSNDGADASSDLFSVLLANSNRTASTPQPVAKKQQAPVSGQDTIAVLHKAHYDVTAATLERLLETESVVAFPTDGLVFTPKDMPYVLGMSEMMFKWQPAQQTVADLRGRELDRHPSSPKFKYLSMPLEKKRSIDTEKLRRENTLRALPPNLVYECLPVLASGAQQVGRFLDIYGNAGYAWMPVSIRWDKSHGNAPSALQQMHQRFRQDRFLSREQLIGAVQQLQELQGLQAVPRAADGTKEISPQLHRKGTAVVPAVAPVDCTSRQDHNTSRRSGAAALLHGIAAAGVLGIAFTRLYLGFRSPIDIYLGSIFAFAIFNSWRPGFQLAEDTLSEATRAKHVVHPARDMEFDDLHAAVLQEVASGAVERTVDAHTGLEVFCYNMTRGPPVTPTAAMCRGLVLHPATKRVVATPFVRFDTVARVVDAGALTTSVQLLSWYERTVEATQVVDTTQDMSFPPVNVIVPGMECHVCGCSAEFDSLGDRICFCDSCSKHGCQPAKVGLPLVDDVHGCSVGSNDLEDPYDPEYEADTAIYGTRQNTLGSCNFWPVDDELNMRIYEAWTNQKHCLASASVKVDGSFIIAFVWDGRVKAMTRRRMDSEQALWASTWLHSHARSDQFQPDWTYMFEAVYRDNTHAVQYCFEGLVLLGAVSPEGIELQDDVDKQRLARRLGVMCAPAIRGSWVELCSTLAQGCTSDRTAGSGKAVRALHHALPPLYEGWVLSGPTVGLRCKLVQQSHKRASSAAAHLLHPLVVWDAVRSGKSRTELAHGLPGHFQQELHAILDALDDNFCSVQDQLMARLKTDTRESSGKSRSENQETKPHPSEKCMSVPSSSSTTGSCTQNTTDSTAPPSVLPVQQKVHLECCGSNAGGASTAAGPSWCPSPCEQVNAIDVAADITTGSCSGSDTTYYQSAVAAIPTDGLCPPLQVNCGDYGTAEQQGVQQGGPTGNADCAKTGSVTHGSEDGRLQGRHGFKVALQYVLEKGSATVPSMFLDHTRYRTSPGAVPLLRSLILDCIQPGVDGSLRGYVPSPAFQQTYAKGWKSGPKQGRMGVPRYIAPVLQLPDQIQQAVLLDYLDGDDLVIAMLVCKDWKNMVQQNPKKLQEAKQAKQAEQAEQAEQESKQKEKAMERFRSLLRSNSYSDDDSFFYGRGYCSP